MGGIFKTPEVGQRILASAMEAPVTVMDTAGEGGAWGIALLAAYMMDRHGSLYKLLGRRRVWTRPRNHHHTFSRRNSRLSDIYETLP